jgi:hypothetical protein
MVKSRIILFGGGDFIKLVLTKKQMEDMKYNVELV